MKKCWVSLQLAAPTRLHSFFIPAGGLWRPASLLALSLRSFVMPGELLSLFSFHFNKFTNSSLSSSFTPLTNQFLQFHSFTINFINCSWISLFSSLFILPFNHNWSEWKERIEREVKIDESNPPLVFSLKERRKGKNGEEELNGIQWSGVHSRQRSAAHNPPILLISLAGHQLQLHGRSLFCSNALLLFLYFINSFILKEWIGMK